LAQNTASSSLVIARAFSRNAPTASERAALAARFGRRIRFPKQDRDAYLAICRRLAADRLDDLPDDLDERLRALAESREIGLGKFLQPIRVALSGTTVSPGIFETLEVLGREESLRRIDAALAAGPASD